MRKVPVYVCICEAVTEAEVRSCVARGARTVDKVGEGCQAGTNCGSCQDRIDELIDGMVPGRATDSLPRTA